MKILFTTGSKESILNYTLDLASYLEKTYKVKIGIITTESSENKKIFSSSFEVFDSNINTIWQNNFDVFFQNIQNLDKFTSTVIKGFDPDIVHFNHIGLNSIDKPSTLHFHDDILNQLKWQEKKGRNFPYLKRHKQFRHFVLNNINNYDCILTTSRFCALNILKTYNVQKPFKVIENSVLPLNIPVLNPKKSIVTVLDEYNRKNALKLLGDLALKLPSDINIFIVSNRSGNFLNSDNIKYIDSKNINEVEDVFLNSSIYLALGNWDYFNYWAIQASLRNCAIVANDIPFYREFWKDTGVLFERNNLSSLVKNINNLLENPALEQKTAHNCRIKSLSAFSLKTNASKYFNLYSELIKQKKKIVQKV